jgi:cyclin D3
VDECCKLILKLWSGYEEENNQCNKRKSGSIIPSSPNGVMDVSFSCENSNDSWAIATTTTASISSSPEPLSKKIRTQEQLLLNSSKSDFLSIPH